MWMAIVAPAWLQNESVRGVGVGVIVGVKVIVGVAVRVTVGVGEGVGCLFSKGRNPTKRVGVGGLLVPAGVFWATT